VDQDAALRIAERSQHALDFAPPPDEFRARRHRHAPLGVEKRLGDTLGRGPPHRQAPRAERAAAMGANVDPSQMPVQTAAPVGRLQAERLPRHSRRVGDGRARRQFSIEMRREGDRIRVVDRSVPANDVGDRRREPAHKRRREVVPRFGDGLALLAPDARALAAAGEAWGRACAATLRRAAGRQNHQRRRLVPEFAQDRAGADASLAALGGLQQQDWARLLVDVAVTGKLQRLKGSVDRGQSRFQELERARFLHDDPHLQPLRRVEDRRFLGLVIQFVLAFRRRRHKHQLQVAVARLERQRHRADAARDDEQAIFVERERRAVRARKQLPRCVEQRFLLRAAGAAHANLEAAVARAERPGRGPAAFVEPSEHRAPDLRKLAFVVEPRGLVVALRPRLQLRNRRLGGKPRLFASALDRGENVGAYEFDQTRRHRYVLPRSRRGARRI
jgi:hypothetical protein